MLFIGHNCIKAQTTHPTQAFGEVDTADLRLTKCDFEKGANAMVLFDKAEIISGPDSITAFRHKRIKIFNDNSTQIANIRLPYYSRHGFEEITDLQAETISLDNNNIVITKLEPKLIYTEIIDKNRKALVFTFPGVKAGSIIEYQYKWKSTSPVDFPVWFYQSNIPERYSEITAFISNKALYKVIQKGKQPFVKDTVSDSLNFRKEKIGYKHCWAKTNVNSLIDEPFMTMGTINLQCSVFHLHYINGSYGLHTWTDTWPGIALGLINDEDFGGQLKENISDQDVLIKNAKMLKTNDEKIAYLFSEVRNAMKWNQINTWNTDKGIRSAWSKKTGNSTEINLILYHLLKKSGINASPMVVSTRDNGAIDLSYASYSQINKTVAYVPIDSTHYYILDATSKYNVYNEVPAELLNTYGLRLDRIDDSGLHSYNVGYKMLLLNNDIPAKQVIITNAEIKADGRVGGTTTINNYSYSKAETLKAYELLGEARYKDILSGGDNHIKISELDMQNMEVDSLPLIQHFSFDLDLNTSDDNHIYFDPNIFTPLRSNPFLNERRVSNIDFEKCNSYIIIGAYKLPNGYKVDALPKNITLNMFDQSIRFIRIVVETNGTVQLRYSITHKKSTYTAEEYQPLYDFYKKMYDMLNEPIVLKKTS